MDSGGESGLLYVVEWLVSGVAALFSAIVGWFVNTAHTKINSQESDLDRMRQEHNNFRIEVANTYAKNHALEAITDRIDNTLDEIRGDIKTLLQRK